MEIIQQILPLNHRLRIKGIYKKTTITVHSTGNQSSSAQNERDWLDNNLNTRDASWHYVVGENTAIQALPDDAEAWHCGDSIGNKYSLSVEICESGDRRKTLLNAAELVAHKSEELGITENEIIRHYEWTGKNCPRILIDNNYIRDGMDWKWFIGEVKKNMSLLSSNLSSSSSSSISSSSLTQEQFNKMMDNYLAKRAMDEPSDWSRAAREWAEANNIIVGDEQGRKRYKSFVTREELAAVLNRAKGV